MTRIVVAPGQVIGSTWGNQTHDQGTIIFTSTTQRDADWPSPPAGARCYVNSVGWQRRQGGAWVLEANAAGLPAANGVLSALTSISAVTNNPLSSVATSGGITVSTPNIIVPVAGKYLVTATVNFSVVASRAWFFLADAGSVNLYNSSTSTTAGSASSLAGVVILAASDQIKFMVNAASWPITTTVGPGIGVFNVAYLGS